MKIGSIGSNKSQQNFAQSQRRQAKDSGFEGLLRDKLEAKHSLLVPVWIPAAKQPAPLTRREMGIRA